MGDMYCEAQGGECAPGTEQCYYILAQGLCDGNPPPVGIDPPRADRIVKVAALGFKGKGSDQPNITRFLIKMPESLLGAAKADIPIAYKTAGHEIPSKWKTINCHNVDKPSIKISKPKKETSPSGTTLRLRGKARDAAGNDITALLQWNLDGSAIGTGGEVVTLPVTPGKHTIKASVTDSGVPEEKEIDFTV